MKYAVLLFIFFIQLGFSQTLLQPERVFDGKTMHDHWVVVITGNKITYAGPSSGAANLKFTKTIDLAGTTLMPGIIEGHSHILLHPYNETSWNVQVLKESPAERAIRATNHAKKSLMAGVTTMRDLGSEGAGYTDLSVKKSIDEGIIPGPRLLVAGPAIVATGAYGPKGFHEGVTVPLGAETASGVPQCIETVRRQMGHGIDEVKVYADYRWASGEPSHATFLQEELDAMVATAKSAGKYVTAHAGTPEGMLRAINAGVRTIEHGDGGTPEVFKLMKSKGVGLCPTIAAGDAISRYSGWRKDVDPEPERIKQKRASFKSALDAGVKIVFGGDVGVFPHGENYREMELMVDFGMKPLDVLVSATSGNAHMFDLDDLGVLKTGFLADIIAVKGNPLKDISVMKDVSFVMKDGVIYKD
ncbi:metal-dependent hydrolase family protein [Gaetbulibacter aestuarii]|uniref:Amidohydrolase family protein n=1 Tax=Gaetbulibacter aestuarii TaxID=1502358 RepID=A0ABW7MVA4_9FLAO